MRRWRDRNIWWSRRGSGRKRAGQAGCRLCWPCCCLSLAGLVFYQWHRQMQPAAVEKPESNIVELRFPQDSFGALYACDAELMNQVEWEPYAEARGLVNARKGLALHLKVNEEAAEDLSPLADLDTSLIRSIWLPGFSATAENLQLLARFSELKELYIDRTTNEVEKTRIQEALPYTLIETRPPDSVAFAEVTKAPEARTLGFPAASVGRLFIREWSEAGSNAWREYALAKGAIPIEAGIEVKLEVDSEMGGSLSFLEKIGAEDLHTLGLVGKEVGNDSMVYLRNLTGLQGLRLLYTQVGDEGLKHLERLTMLREVELYSIGMTDRGFEVFSQCPHLQFLWISGAKLTNKSLPIIREFHSLRRLHLSETGISKEGLVSLQFDMDHCEITPLPGE